jgi:CubicO group peptidase (beta-lactamase class C family)
VALLIGLLFWVNFCAAQISVPTPKTLEDFDSIVTRAMDDAKIPGISIAIVREGKVIYAKDLGYRDVEGKLPVTTDTIFCHRLHLQVLHVAHLRHLE